MFLYVNLGLFTLKEVILILTVLMIIPGRNKIKMHKNTLVFVVLIFLLMLIQQKISTKPFLYLFLYGLTANICKTKQIHNFMNGNMLVLTITFIFVVFQAFNFSPAWNIRGIFGFNHDEAVAMQFYARGKPFGLHFYSVSLAQHAAVILPFFLVNKISHFLFFIYAILLRINSFLIGIFLKYYKKLLYILPLLLVYWFYFGISREFQISVIGRIALYSKLLAVDYGIQNSVYNFFLEYVGTSGALFDIAFIEEKSPHNYFVVHSQLLSGSSAGWLIGLISLFPSLFINFYPIYLLSKLKDSTSSKLFYCLLAGCFHSLTHGGGMLIGGHIYFVMIIISLNHYYYQRTITVSNES